MDSTDKRFRDDEASRRGYSSTSTLRVIRKQRDMRLTKIV
ncbi:hypothetical protein Pcac1_g7795 [Phytophthora cactorum]|nr:hypothetical protein Pcac1_g7795 [Phytophthora cactorum]KAG4044715.1 hypothetical protein PC123_g19860 [Phytophthora cactorum]